MRNYRSTISRRIIFLAVVFIACSSAFGQGKCFGNDVGAASTNEMTHLTWARKQGTAGLKDGLKSKLEAIFNCPGIRDEDLYNFYATLSIIITDYVSDAA
jgi:hypothetical protein